jgi:hypothetical protein
MFSWQEGRAVHLLLVAQAAVVTLEGQLGKLELPIQGAAVVGVELFQVSHPVLAVALVAISKN